jgi:hypothetical protein
VVGVGFVEEGHERAGVNEYAAHGRIREGSR